MVQQTKAAGGITAVCLNDASWSLARQHFLYFLPLPHGQGSLRPAFMDHSRARVQLDPQYTSRALSDLLQRDFRRLALDHLLFHAADRRRRVDNDDMPLHQPVEETA